MTQQDDIETLKEFDLEKPFNIGPDVVQKIHIYQIKNKPDKWYWKFLSGNRVTLKNGILSDPDKQMIFDDVLRELRLK